MDILKSFADFLGLTNVLLKIVDAFIKCKDKMFSVLAFVILIIAASTYAFMRNDSSNYDILVLILLATTVLLFIIHISSSMSKKHQLNDVKAHYEHKLSMQSEEHKCELSINSDQHLRKISDLIFEHNREIEQLQDILEKTKILLIQNYYNLHHDFRNTINSIEKHHKSHSQNQAESISIEVIRFTQDLLDNLAVVFTQLTGETVCACVKIMDYTDSNTLDYNSASVKTFLRSKNTDKNRRSYHEAHPKPVKLCKNTDFMEVVSQDRLNPSSCFYQGNLPAYDAELKKINREYENTTYKYARFYKGTIVAPIRIANQYIFYTDKEEGYNTIGFLCVDSKSVTAFPPESEDIYTNIMRAYAAILYNVLSKYQFYLAEQDKLNQQLKSNSSNPPQQTQHNRRKNTGFRNRSK